MRATYLSIAVVTCFSTTVPAGCDFIVWHFRYNVSVRFSDGAIRKKNVRSFPR